MLNSNSRRTLTNKSAKESNAQHKPLQRNSQVAPISSRTTKIDSTDYVALDTFRRETINKEQESLRVWKEKFDPWLTDEYRAMYANRIKESHTFSNNHGIVLNRSEWRQPADALPPLNKRLPGQRRRRLLGSFPETENDKIGWRLLPEHAIDRYGSKAANIPPLPKQYKFSSWPVESFH